MNPVLVIEDSDSKFAAIAALLAEVNDRCEIIRAATLIEAEREVAERDWSLVVLDISMDIAPSRMGHKSRGQANIGGLGIAQKMFLLDREAPTIIVTAFDSFTTSNVAGIDTEIMDFDEIEKRASKYIPNSLLGCLQYNNRGWKSKFQELCSGVLK